MTEAENQIILPDLPPTRGIMERPYTGQEIKAQVNMIQEVIEAVFKEGHHYGKIPGTGDRQTLLKPGAEKLCLTFRIAPKHTVEDLSTEDSIRYRVTSEAWHIVSGDYLGAGLGEASSDEEKYKWRKAKVKAEWEATPEDRRRISWQKNWKSREFQEVQQVRTNPADIANTVLKMAKKRANVDMTLSVTAASDVFAQDYDDMTSEMRHSLGQDQEPLQQPAEIKPKAKKAAPKAKKAPPKKKAEPKSEEPPPAPEGDPEPPTAFQEAAAARGVEPPDEEDLPLGGEMADPDDDNTITDRLEVVKFVKEGVSGGGNAWTLYHIETSNGTRLACFDKNLVTRCDEALAEGQLCRLEYRETDKGLNLLDMTVIG